MGLLSRLRGNPPGWRPDPTGRHEFRTYAFATNRLGPPSSVSGLSGITGVDFDNVTGDLLAVTNRERLCRVSMATGTIRAGWNGISLTRLGLRDTRAVEVIGRQVFVSDGYDRRPSNPRNHAVFVIGVT
jgi:hypothetical protein